MNKGSRIRLHKILRGQSDYIREKGSRKTTTRHVNCKCDAQPLNEICRNMRKNLVGFHTFSDFFQSKVGDFLKIFQRKK